MKNDKRYRLPALILGVAFAVLMAVIHFEDRATHKKAALAYINYLLENRERDRQRVESEIKAVHAARMLAWIEERVEEREQLDILKADRTTIERKGE